MRARNSSCHPLFSPLRHSRVGTQLIRPKEDISPGSTIGTMLWSELHPALSSYATCYDLGCIRLWTQIDHALAQLRHAFLRQLSFVMFSDTKLILLLFCVLAQLHCVFFSAVPSFDLKHSTFFLCNAGMRRVVIDWCLSIYVGSHVATGSLEHGEKTTCWPFIFCKNLRKHDSSFYSSWILISTLVILRKNNL